MKKRNSPYNIDYQMERFKLSKEEAEKKINDLKAKRGKPYNLDYQMTKFNLSKEEAETKIAELKIKTGSNYNAQYVAKLNNISLEEAELKILAIKKAGSESVKNTIAKIRETEEGDKIFRSKSNRCIEHWVKKGYTEEEGKLKISELQKDIGNEWVKKNKENPELYQDRTTSQIGYWVKKGYSEEEAEKLRNERQATFSLDKCIEKHGIEEGRRIWQERQEKWMEKWQKGYKEGKFDTHTFEGSQSKIAKKFIFCNYITHLLRFLLDNLHDKNKF